MNENAVHRNEKIAEMLFPNITKSPEDYEKIYPKRNLKEGAMVTRFAPSPTGFLHIGGVLSSLIDKRLAMQSDGVFILRIEDTDKKREIEDGIGIIIRGLNKFGIVWDEGPVNEDTEKGVYGPYVQSERKEIYQTYVKDLVKKGLAYPCFDTHEDLERMRQEQEKLKVETGYYGEWAIGRNIELADIEKNIAEGKEYVIRFRSSGSLKRFIQIDDCIKGKIKLPENIQDTVILKSDGLPTYHFAHVIDDHLMRVTHVIRGDEWLPSTPIHLELFNAVGFEPPKYCHMAPIVKIDGTSKRKLSKRKDPEASVEYYYEEGYFGEAVIEYLLTLVNSNYEEWRLANKGVDNKEFIVSFAKMSESGALFDAKKLFDISTNVIAGMKATEVYDNLLKWANQYDEQFAKILASYEDYTKQILNIERNTEKIRKDIAKWSEVKGLIKYFYDELFDNKATYGFPEHLSKKDIEEVITNYMKIHTTDVDEVKWLEDVKLLAGEMGYAPSVKIYRQQPEAYKGHIGDFTMTLRVALTKETKTPNIYEVMKVMGIERVLNRLELALESFK